MSEGKPASQCVRVDAPATGWSDATARATADNAAVLIEQDGRPVAAIISYSEYQRFQKLDANRRERFQALYDTWEAFRDLPPEEVEREAARAVAEVRAEMRAEAGRSASRS